MPVHCIAPDSDAQCHDEQMAWEKIITFFAALNSGVNIFMNCGMFSTGLIASFEQLVIDNELAGFLLRAIKGIDVNEDTLALDLIRKVGPKGHFLNQMHTVRHIRTEYWLPELSNRATYKKWVTSGSRDVLVKAKEKVQKILREHKAPKLDVVKRNQIRGIIKKFERMKGV
jgi:trimethylamine--corrinoid protein Co-methyltransferase